MEKNIKNNLSKYHGLSKIAICFALLLVVFLLPQYSNKSLATEKQRIFLSDIPYDSDKIEEKSRVGWGSITMNKNLDSSKNNGLISLIVDNKTKTFLKGISAHANSQVIFDVEDLVAQGFTKFSTYYGVDAGRGSVGSAVAFKITYKTETDSPWQDALPLTTYSYKGNTQAGFIEIDLTGKKFIKLEAYCRGNNIDSAHACYGNAQVYKPGFTEESAKADFIKTVEEYDSIIKEKASANNFNITEDYEITLLQRDLVNAMGYDLLQEYVALSPDNLNIVRWLMTDINNLRSYVMGGIPDGGNYYNSLDILAKLYKEYSSDFENVELLNNPTHPEMTYGDLYKKMAISIALTHTQRVGLWMQAAPNGENDADPLRRYAIFKYMHKNDKLKITNSMDMTHMFEDLHIEEMRILLSNSIDDEEILWLNKYVQDNVDKNPNNVWRYTTPHPYIAYVWPNYANPVYYAEENVDYFNELFAVNKSDDNIGTELADENGQKTGKIGLFDSEFVIPGGKDHPEYRLKVTRGTDDYKLYKVWMNFRNKFGTGAVCGGISKSGANIRGTHGIPAIVVGQPGHAALLFYSKDAEGRGYWRIDNDVSGWTATGKSARFLGWGNGSHASGYTGVYMEFEQAAVNDHDNLIKAEEQIMLAKVYMGDLAKQEQLYRKALEIQSINFDAWLGLINVYNLNEAKTENDFYGLAEELAENLKYFPLPMYHATNLIKPKLTSTQNSYKFALLQTRTLTEASTLPNNTGDSFTVMQPGVTRLEATYLLGQIDKTIATFSFDGEDAGKIVLSSRFDGNGVRWDYSIDGKQTWKEVSFTAEQPHKLQLTQQELASITAENDIYVHIVGVNYDENNLYKIDITNGNLPNNLYANDLENRVVGVNLGTEWRYTENDPWISYSVASPDLTGNKTVQVRQAATENKLASIATEMYTFTEDNQPNTRKYITVAHLAIEAYSTQSVDSKRPYYAPNAIDGNMNTLWHTDFRENVLQQETKPFITIKLDEPRYISALEFIQRKYPGKPNDPDNIKNGIVYVSMDGTNWTEAGRIENCSTYGQLYNIEFNESVYGQYVKLEMETYNMFSSLAMVNLFEDLTKKETIKPTAGIYYSTTESTNELVVARLINPSTTIKITNNNGSDTYVFTENGEFEFQFEDAHGNKGSALAKVTWIDKKAPTVDVNYKLSDDKKLIAILDNIDEDVYLLDNSNKKTNFVEVENGKIVSISFLDENEEIYKISQLDENKVTEKITYKNTTGNVSRVKYYTVTFRKDQNGNVLSEVETRTGIDEDGNTITLTENEIQELKALEAMRSNPLEFYLEENEEYEFVLLDKASNRVYKNIRVDYIENDTKILASDITYSTTMATNENVKATIKPYLINMEGKSGNVEVINNNKSTEYVFTENGKFTFQYAEAKKDENREIKTHIAKVTWIDKIAPTAEIRYSTTEKTTEPVTARLVNESEEIQILNNGTSREYTFSKNGEFTFRFKDKAGNIGTATAKVNWITEDSKDPNEPQEPVSPEGITSKKYKIEDKYISRISPLTTVSVFKQNVETKQDIVITDKSGNILKENDLIGTNSKIKVGSLEYTLIVIGDTNSDAKADLQDILQINKHRLNKTNLKGTSLIAGDVNQDGKVDLQDILQINKYRLGKINNL